MELIALDGWGGPSKQRKPMRSRLGALATKSHGWSSSSWSIPNVYLWCQNSCWKWPSRNSGFAHEKMMIFHSYVNVYQMVSLHLNGLSYPQHCWKTNWELTLAPKNDLDGMTTWKFPKSRGYLCSSSALLECWNLINLTEYPAIGVPRTMEAP